MQQLTCKIDLPFSFYYLFFSFVLLELKTLCFEGESPGGKIMKKCQKGAKNYETILPFSCCPLVFFEETLGSPLLPGPKRVLASASAPHRGVKIPKLWETHCYHYWC